MFNGNQMQNPGLMVLHTLLTIINSTTFTSKTTPTCHQGVCRKRAGLRWQEECWKSKLTYVCLHRWRLSALYFWCLTITPCARAHSSIQKWHYFTSSSQRAVSQAYRSSRTVKRCLYGQFFFLGLQSVAVSMLQLFSAITYQVQLVTQLLKSVCCWKHNEKGGDVLLALDICEYVWY